MKIKSKLGYEIEIEKGIIKDRGLPKGFIVTDSNIYKEYTTLLYNRKFMIINAGEDSKNLDNYKRTINALKNGYATSIIAFGGGMVGDLAGFAASTYKRGVEFIQVPTTLLAMIDSSIGGKNGVNYGCIKNKIGTIYQPKKILIDPLFLETLSKEEFKNGVAEIIKYGYLFGQPISGRLKKGVSKKDSDLEEIIWKCCKIKNNVVEIDVFDKSYRHVLNFGHTIGHAIELLGKLKHGEAISIGMVKELELGERIGIINKGNSKKIEYLLKKNNLPVELPSNLNKEKVIENINQDKKGSFVFALNKNNYNVKIDESVVSDMLQDEI